MEKHDHMLWMAEWEGMEYSQAKCDNFISVIKVLTTPFNVQYLINGEMMKKTFIIRDVTFLTFNY